MASNVKIKVGANLNAFRVGMRSVKRHLRNLNRQIKTVMKPIAVLKGMSGAAFTLGMKDIAAYGAELNHMSASTGLSVKQLTILRQAFEDVGSEASDVEPSLAKLQQMISQATDVTGPLRLKQAFRALKIDPWKVSRLSPMQQFEEIGDAISNIENQTKRTDIFRQLFGRSGTKLAPLFLTPGALQDAGVAAGPLAELMEQTHVSLERFDTILGRAKTKIRTFFAGVAIESIPRLEAFFERFNTLDTSQFGRTLGQTINDMLSLIQNGKIWEYLAFKIKALGYMLADALVQIIVRGVPFIVKTFVEALKSEMGPWAHRIFTNNGQPPKEPGFMGIAKVSNDQANILAKEAREWWTAQKLPTQPKGVANPRRFMPFADPAAPVSTSMQPVVDSLQQIGGGGNISRVNYLPSIQQNTAEAARQLQTTNTLIGKLLQPFTTGLPETLLGVNLARNY